MTLTVQHLIDWDTAADHLLTTGLAHTVWGIYGEMGAGKTTLVKALCRRLGVLNPIQSPTFSIVNEYITVEGKLIYHFDCYRLRNEAEALDIGMEEYLDSGAICFIEWPEQISNLLPSDTWPVTIRVEGATRIITTIRTS